MGEENIQIIVNQLIFFVVISAILYACSGRINQKTTAKRISPTATKKSP